MRVSKKLKQMSDNSRIRRKRRLLILENLFSYFVMLATLRRRFFILIKRKYRCYNTSTYCCPFSGSLRFRHAGQEAVVLPGPERPAVEILDLHCKLGRTRFAG